MGITLIQVNSPSDIEQKCIKRTREKDMCVFRVHTGIEVQDELIVVYKDIKRPPHIIPAGGRWFERMYLYADHIRNPPP
jgi:hypothetical protein